MRRKIDLYIGEGRPFTRVEYLETADGLPCIDTGIVPNANTKVELGFKCTAAAAWMGVVGNYIDETHNCVRLAQANNPNRYIANPNTNAGNATTVYKAVTYGWQTASISQTKCIVDNAEATPTLTQGTANTTNIALFKNRVTTSVVGTREQISWCKIWDGADLIRDFVPVRVGSVGYMLERVSGTLYGNAGAGAFVIGADIEAPFAPADLADDSFVLMNYKREDLESPAAVLNSWSQAVTLPRTGRNDELLGHYFRLDHTTSGAGGIGLDFNALKRTPFSIYDVRGHLIQAGYVKLDKVTEDAYSLTLYGGMGGMFYALTYDEGGSDKLTLADLKYDVGGTFYDTSAIAMPSVIATISDAWDEIINNGAPFSNTKYDILNFAPALNGTEYPFKFDTNKAMVTVGTSGTAGYVINLYDTASQGGQTYGPMEDSGGNPLPLLVEMGDKHNEWEVQDLRTYCQRPVISLVKMLEAIVEYARAQGYTLEIDAEFADASNPYYANVWMSLPFLNRDNYTVAQLSSLTLANYLKGTATPCDYLLAIAKTFGFVFLPENDGSTVRMMLRDNFYDFSNEIDLTDLVDRSKDMEVKPLNVGSRFYEWKTEETFGGFAKDYETRNGRIYGSQRVDTGYAFNGEVKNVIEGNVLNGAADVRDKNGNYQVVFGEYSFLPPPDDRIRRATNYAFKFAWTDTVKWDLYHYDAYGEIDGNITCEPTAYVTPQMEDYDVNSAMFYDLPQLCGTDGKAEDGDNVLLFFEGAVSTPSETIGLNLIYQAVFHLSVDRDEPITKLNGGVPCWDMRYSGTGISIVSSLPTFRRWHYSGGSMVASLDYGDPTEVAVLTPFTAGVNIYRNYWADYIADRLDANTSVLRARVNLDGWDVGDALFRNLYHYGGSIWVLNDIENHSLTTADTTLCEFVRVNDTDAYTNGQI